MAHQNNAIVEVERGQLTRMESADSYLLAPVMDLALAKKRLAEFQEFVGSYMVEGEDFGKIPGTPKPTLFKAGADKLCELYGMADDYVFMEKIEDYDRGLFDYTIKCNLTKKGGTALMASGLGSCTSFESKYKWREGKRKCPSCSKEAIIKGKQEYGGGWLCFGKKGGCGAKFTDDDKRITEQVTGKVLNDDMADIKNTILKMALKRAKVSAVLSATRSSGIFSQDLEDNPGESDSHHENRPPQQQQPPQQQPSQQQAPEQTQGRAKAPKAGSKKTEQAAPAQTAAPAAQSGPPKANIPPMNTAAPGKTADDLKMWAREAAKQATCSPDQLAMFLKRILRVEDLAKAPKEQKVVAIGAIFELLKAFSPEAVGGFIRGELHDTAIDEKYGNLLTTVPSQIPA